MSRAIKADLRFQIERSESDAFPYNSSLFAIVKKARPFISLPINGPLPLILSTFPLLLPTMIYHLCLLPLLATVTLACGATGSGAATVALSRVTVVYRFSGSDAQLLQNPTFSFEFSPPIGWTFFTIAAVIDNLLTTVISYRNPLQHTGNLAASVAFPGQRATLIDAQQQIQNDLDNAVGHIYIPSGYGNGCILYLPLSRSSRLSTR